MYESIKIKKMEKFISDFNHWWGYLLIAYYLTWVITYQVLMYQNIRRGGGIMGCSWKHMKSVFKKEIIKGKIEIVGDFFWIILVGIWLFVCAAWWIFCWAFSTIIGFVPVLNNMIASWKTFYDEKGDYYVFECADWKKTFLIQGWKLVFEAIAAGIWLLCTISLRKKDV
jgi:hypothetical protein